jgi:hypothetical protein
MEKATRLTQQHRENLVAYLDGELDESESQEIDRILARSDVARHEVEALSRAWEMLDLLPQPKASSEFTEKTMTTLKLKEIPTSLADQPWFLYVRRGAVATVWLGAIAASAVIGFLAAWQWYPNPNRQLLEELPVIKQLDVYAEVDSLEFLEALRREGLFDGGGSNAPPSKP